MSLLAFLHVRALVCYTRCFVSRLTASSAVFAKLLLCVFILGKTRKYAYTLNFTMIISIVLNSAMQYFRCSMIRVKEQFKYKYHLKVQNKIVYISIFEKYNKYHTLKMGDSLLIGTYQQVADSEQSAILYTFTYFASDILQTSHKIYKLYI